MIRYFYRSVIVLPALISLNLFLWSCNQSSQEEIIFSESSDADQNDSIPIPVTLGEQVIRYATTLLNTPYKIAGKDSLGFDCSGFVSYVFKKYGVEVPSSSRHIARLGNKISIEEAHPGDLVFFRGTDPNSTEVGHIGIVVSAQGEPIKFIHSSSAQASPYVKYDSLSKPNYNRRFIMVKRIID
ncbi:C40 family peptidase [Rhodocytophaga rosea]|uniref:C40 family peptidase n=1 Tax=Rhodocytophaga rosea TaxID=2704465 RepID=A0A6C0GKB9_9BACT|nr:C40 family peptidase [Rhodocytophaga rosea]QHT68102.1 C40 family peptidase [Rhodocytophaga rosea]